MHPLSAPWREALSSHLALLRGRGRSPRSLADRRGQLAAAFHWLDAEGLRGPDAVRTADLERYAAALAAGRRIPATCRNHLTALRVFFRTRPDRTPGGADPSAPLVLPPPSRALPRVVLATGAVARLAHVALNGGRNRLRNRALVEVLYATGVRRAECAQLTIGDVDFQRRTLSVRHGKGQRQRVVPIADRALRWIAAYLRRERRLAKREIGWASPLFAGPRGRWLTPPSLSSLVRTLFVRAGMSEPGACHAFRHAMATHMLDHGADVRHIQVMLGHADISTTMRYTHVSIRGLAEVYRRTHPSAIAERDGARPST